MDYETMSALADRIVAAWNTQDADEVLAWYTEDLVYRDPNTRGIVRGREAMRRYLRSLFALWDMSWTRRQLHPFAGVDGGALSWRASFQHVGSTMRIEVSGMNLVFLRSQRIAINEVYFDRTVLAAVDTETSVVRGNLNSDRGAS